MAGNNIPEDIIVEILSKLPVKSLLRFRCVSKRWCSIVSDPQFSKLQFKVACEQKTLSRRLLFTRNEETPWNGDKPSIRKLTAALELPEWSRLHAEVLGSCNGLVSVATRNIWDPSNGVIQCYIWNPLTGFSHTLPRPGLSYISCSGFGYLPATYDYKVLVAEANGHSEKPVPVEVKIFSTRAGLWKRIESPFNSHLTYKHSGALLGKTFHWVGDSPA
ncbi:hypothetical protein ACLB2K_006170 [Fragaria x ananassa]